MPGVGPWEEVLKNPLLWHFRFGGPAADEEVAYSCRRRLPGPLPAASHVRVRVGAPYQPAELGDRDHFLTARWVLFSVLAGRQFFARAMSRRKMSALRSEANS